MLQAQATPPLSRTGDSGKLDWDCEPNDPAEAVGAREAHTDSSVLGPCSSRPFPQRSTEEKKDPARRKRHPNRDDPGDGEEVSVKVPMAFAHLPLCKIAALGRNAANTSYVVNLPTTGGESMLVESSGANPYRCFWTPPAVVILGGLHINLLLNSRGGRAYWHNECRSPNSRPKDQW